MEQEPSRPDVGEHEQPEVAAAGTVYNEFMGRVSVTQEEAQAAQKAIGQESLMNKAMSMAKIEDVQTERGERPVQDHFDDATRYLKEATTLNPDIPMLDRLQVLRQALMSREAVWMHNAENSAKAGDQASADRQQARREEIIKKITTLNRGIAILERK